LASAGAVSSIMTKINCGSLIFVKAGRL